MRLALILAAVVSLAPMLAAPARAEERRVGISPVLAALGEITSWGGDSCCTSAPAAPTFGLASSIDWVAPGWFVGLAPQVTFNLHSNDGDDHLRSTVAGDLLLRLGLAHHLEPDVIAQLWVAPGLWMASRPRGSGAVGAAVAAHAGILTNVDRSAFWQLEIGYQLDYSPQYRLRYITVALGGGLRW